LGATKDLIVIGGGPCGSSCARRAAELGLSVLLLERATFPRAKPCAAGLTDKALALLGTDALAVQHRRFESAEIAFAGAMSLIVSCEETLVATTTRRELDEHLMELAGRAGATVQDSRSVDMVEEEAGAVRVRAGSDVLTAGYVVAADGARGTTRRKLGLRPLTMGGGIYVRSRPPSGDLPEERAARLLFDPTATKRGYAWVFPKRDHLNVGIFSQRPLDASIKEDLRSFLELHELGQWPAEGPFAFPIPVSRPRDALGTERVLFAGDAAGLVNPVTGEGISSAVLSGRIAAESVAARAGWRGGTGPAADYARGVREEVLPMTDASRRKGALAYGLGPGLIRFLARARVTRAAIGPAWRAATAGSESLAFRVVVPPDERRRC
jgi:geranylgeranyl reductase family protein